MIHGRFESQYLDLIGVTEEDVVKYMRKEPRLLDNVWKAVLDHSLEARGFTEDVYRLDLRGAFGKKDDLEARELVCKRLGRRRGISARSGLHRMGRKRQAGAAQRIHRPAAKPGQSAIQSSHWLAPAK